MFETCSHCKSLVSDTLHGIHCLIPRCFVPALGREAILTRKSISKHHCTSSKSNRNNHVQRHNVAGSIGKPLAAMNALTKQEPEAENAGAMSFLDQHKICLKFLMGLKVYEEFILSPSYQAGGQVYVSSVVEHGGRHVPCTTIAVDPTDSLLYVVAGSSVRIVNQRSLSTMCVVGPNSRYEVSQNAALDDVVTAVAICEKGLRLAVGRRTGACDVFELDKEKWPGAGRRDVKSVECTLRETVTGDGTAVTSLSWSKSRSSSSRGDGVLAMGFVSGLIKVVDAFDGVTVSGMSSQKAPVTGLILLPTQGDVGSGLSTEIHLYCAAATMDGTVTVWDCRYGLQVQALLVNPKPYNGPLFLAEVQVESETCIAVMSSNRVELFRQISEDVQSLSSSSVSLARISELKFQPLKNQEHMVSLLSTSVGSEPILAGLYSSGYVDYFAVRHSSAAETGVTKRKDDQRQAAISLVRTSDSDCIVSDSSATGSAITCGVLDSRSASKAGVSQVYLGLSCNVVQKSGLDFSVGASKKPKSKQKVEAEGLSKSLLLCSNEGHHDSPLFVSAVPTPDGTSVVSASSTELCVWNAVSESSDEAPTLEVVSRAEVKNEEQDAAVTSILQTSVPHEGESVQVAIVGFSDGYVRVYSLQNLSVATGELRLETGSGSDVIALRTCSYGATTHIYAFYKKGGFHQLEVSLAGNSKGIVQSVKSGKFEHEVTSSAVPLEFLSGSMCAVATVDNIIGLHFMDSLGKVKHPYMKLYGHSLPVTDMQFLKSWSDSVVAPLLSCSLDKTLRLWDTKFGSMIRFIRDLPEIPVSIALLPISSESEEERPLCIVADKGGAVNFWDLSDRVSPQRVLAHSRGCNGISVVNLEDGPLIVSTGSDFAVRTIRQSGNQITAEDRVDRAIQDEITAQSAKQTGEVARTRRVTQLAELVSSVAETGSMRPVLNCIDGITASEVGSVVSCLSSNPALRFVDLVEQNLASSSKDVLYPVVMACYMVMCLAASFAVDLMARDRAELSISTSESRRVLTRSVIQRKDDASLLREIILLDLNI